MARGCYWMTCPRKQSRQQCASALILAGTSSCPGRLSQQRRHFHSKAGAILSGLNLRKRGAAPCGVALQLRDLNICFVAGTLGQGGAERQLFFMVRTLREAGARVRVLSLTKNEFWQRPIEDCGAEVIHIGARQNRLARALGVIREIRRERPDILQSQHFYTNLYVWLAAGVTGVPGIGAIRSDVTNEVAANGSLLGPLSLKAPRYLIANSGAAVETTRSRGVRRERVFLLPNAVDRVDGIK